MEPDSSLPHSKVPATCPYPEPARPSQYPHIQIPDSHLIVSIHLRLGLPSGHFPSRFPHQNPVHAYLLPIRATCPAHLILLDFITNTILSDQYRSWSSSLWSVLLSPLTLSLLGTNILLNTLKHPQPTFLPQCQRPSFTLIQNNRQNYISVYFNL
jgi:hypothetical protein